MRILQLNHQIPPFSRQGSELACWHLSQNLAATEDVALFHISDVARKSPRRLERSTPDGFPVYHCIDGCQFSRVADWPNPFLRQQFQSVLDEWRPEIVHFHNYISLGDNLPGMAKSHGASVVYTLHDYGLICPNNILQRQDGTLCGKCQGDFFQDCCPVPIRSTGGRVPLFRHRIPSLARWQTFARQQANPLVRLLLQAGLMVPQMIYGKPATARIAGKRDFYLRATRQIFADVDLFLSPSQFLRDRFIACGLPAEKAIHMRYGLRPLALRPRVPAPDGKLRFGYIGAFHAHKGLDVLMRAFEGLHERASLHIHGSCFGSPVSESHWQKVRQSAPASVHFHGAYRNDQLEEILATMDVVVVPSTWYENLPFTIQEAFQAGLPVIAGNDGGMAELVRDGIEGLQFRIGDPEDLRRAMRSVLDDPSQLDRFRRNLPELPTFADETANVLREYARLLRDRQLT